MASVGGGGGAYVTDPMLSVAQKQRDLLGQIARNTTPSEQNDAPQKKDVALK